MVQGGVVVFGGRQPACILRLALRHFSSPPFYLFSSASTIASPDRMDWSEGKSPRLTQWGWVLPESEGSRGGKRGQSERDNM